MLNISGIFKIYRRQKYLLMSVLTSVLVLLLALNVLPFNLPNSLLLIIATVVGVFVVHYPNLKTKNLLIGSILPISMSLGALLSHYYYPNLSVPFKIVSTIVFLILYYVCLLVDNIFLVVTERKEVIPLYRVAVTWSQILVILLSIPVFSGLFKLPVNSIVQVTLLSLISVIFVFYLIWSSIYDTGVKNVKIGEGMALLLFVFVCMFGTGISVAFLPSEAFLRALFMSSVLMFVMNYILTGYLRNEISKKLISEYLFISGIFLIFLLIFD